MSQQLNMKYPLGTRLYNILQLSTPYASLKLATAKIQKCYSGYYYTAELYFAFLIG